MACFVASAPRNDKLGQYPPMTSVSVTSHHARGVTLMLFSAACFTTNVLLVRALGQIEPVNVWLTSCVRFVAGMGVVYALYRREFEFQRLFRNPKLASRGIVGGAGVYATR